jgi:hypothetical protein
MNPVAVTGLLVAAIRAEETRRADRLFDDPLADALALSLWGSVAIYDVIGQSMLNSPVIAPTLNMMRELGAPWIYGSEQPEELLTGWNANVTEPAIVGNAWKRWPFPAAPRGVPAYRAAI